jgi:hypothetical protein
VTGPRRRPRRSIPSSNGSSWNRGLRCHANGLNQQPGEPAPRRQSHPGEPRTPKPAGPTSLLPRRDVPHGRHEHGCEPACPPTGRRSALGTASGSAADTHARSTRPRTPPDADPAARSRVYNPPPQRGAGGTSSPERARPSATDAPDPCSVSGDRVGGTRRLSAPSPSRPSNLKLPPAPLLRGSRSHAGQAPHRNVPKPT